MRRYLTSFRSTTALGLVLSIVAAPALAQSTDGEELLLDEIVVLTAEEQLKQSLGVSVITSEDLARQPVGRDLSELIRTQPGVNLTGSTASGTFGQQRQIDLRGMGPENTLILIDGKPVLSRNSARMGRRGERDTSGDSNWVPPELIERIEVIRGPAAARYGSGAAGGVVNIITRRPETASYSISTFLEVPESSDEGGTRRVTATASGPIDDVFSYRFTVGGRWTDPDSTDINAQAANAEAGTPGAAQRAGREGSVQYDVRGLVSARIDASHRLDFEASWSRQANRFAGGTPGGAIITNPANATQQAIWELTDSNAETRRLDRLTLSATHVGEYDFGQSNSYIQWERNDGKRLRENLSDPANEGNFNTTNEHVFTVLDNITGKTEWNLPLDIWREQNLTLGFEYRGEFLKAPIGNAAMAGGQNDSMSQHLIGLYAENNILVTDQWTLTPGLRFDYSDRFGTNLSPSLNTSYDVTDEITVKAGIARAFKAPNLYQLSPDYAWNTMGMGCPTGVPSPCSIYGNPDLDPEISINKEIGIAYNGFSGWAASLTYFYNDYQNKIMGGEDHNGFRLVPNETTGVLENRAMLNWANSGPAVISGLEGSVTVPLHETLSWTTNFTKILQSKREVQGITVPVSLVPEHTINTAFRWEPREDLGLTLSATHYGKILPSPITTLWEQIPVDSQIPRDPYTIFNISMDYEVNDNFRFAAGVKNLFNKQLYATGGAVGTGTSSNANTFNEPGRTYWLQLTGTF